LHCQISIPIITCLSGHQCKGGLSHPADSIHWWIGDWLNYGEESYGKKYKKALEITGLDYGTLANDKYVVKQVKFPQRCGNLTWSHHRDMAPLEPDKQKYWFEFAEQHHLSTGEFKAKIKGAKYLAWLRYTDVWNFTGCEEHYGMEYNKLKPAKTASN